MSNHDCLTHKFPIDKVNGSPISYQGLSDKPRMYNGDPEQNVILQGNIDINDILNGVLPHVVQQAVNELSQSITDLDNEVVHIDEDETIIGNKNFTGDLKHNGSDVEVVGNKSNQVDSSTTKYPSNKAVQDYAVSKKSGENVVYGRANSEETTIPYATNPNANTLIKRDANGRAQVNFPTNPNDIANKDYVDDIQEKIEDGSIVAKISQKATYDENDDKISTTYEKSENKENTLGSDSTTKYPTVHAVKSGIDTLGTTINAKLTQVLKSVTYTYSGDTVTITKVLRNLNTGVESTVTETGSLANSTNAGFMSPSSVIALQELREEVDLLEGQTVRLFYETKSNPTSQEIQAFVVEQGYPQTQWANIGVIVKTTNHIWRYYANDGWQDIGVDTVNQFTNSTPGIIKGSETTGKVYAEDDGTGSVVGWDELVSDVEDVETALTTHENDTTNPHNVTKEQVGLGNVDNTSDLNKPLSTATINALANKVDKITGTYARDRAYIVTSSGSQGVMSISSNALGSNLMSRDANGNSKIATPIANDDIANKQYVDDNSPSIVRMN